MSTSRRRASALDAVGLRQGSGQLEVLSPARRQLLATLIAAGPDGVSVETAADEIWPEGLPKSWESAMRMGFTRLRAELGSDAVTHQNGWCRLERDVVDVDVWTLQQLADRLTTDPATLDTMTAEDVRRARRLATARPFPDVEISPMVREAIERVRDDQRRVITALGGRSGEASIDTILALLSIGGAGCWFHDPGAGPVDGGGDTDLLDDIHRRLSADGRRVVRLAAHAGADVAFGPLLEALPEARPIVAEHLAATEPESVRLARTCLSILGLFEAQGDDVTIVIDHVELLDPSTVDVVSFLLRATAELDVSILARLTARDVSDITEVAPGWPYLERVDFDAS